MAKFTLSSITGTISESANDIHKSSPVLLLVFFAILGASAFASKFISYFRAVFSLFVLPGKNLRSYGKKGSYALVTGASDGIGKEYALQLASQGFNLLLVSRTQSKLDVLSKEIEAKFTHFKTKCQTLAMDFTANREEDYEELGSLIRDLDIAILVNNVGLSHSIPVPFAITPLDEVKDIIEVNCHATLRVTQLVLPGMIQRRKGLILTMGSFGGLLPTPLLATYSGSKAFLQHWSTALAGELAGSGIDVQFVISYLVTSAMSKIRRPSLAIPNPRNFVKAVLAKIGRSGGSSAIAHTSTPFWAHGLMQWWIENTVGTGSRFALGQNRGMHESIRKRALKKAEREAKKA